MANVVKNLFSNSVSLLDYFRTTLGIDNGLVLDDDSPSYLELLATSLIIPPVSEKFDKQHILYTCSLRETLSRLVEQSVRNSQHYRSQNCLSLGYRAKTSNGDTTMRQNIDIECYFINTVQAVILTQSWKLLASRIGTILNW